MPTKRRTPKRRAAGSDEIEAWTDVFLFGCDFSRGLTKAGIAALHGRPDRALLEQAWQRLGPQFLATWKAPRRWPLPMAPTHAILTPRFQSPPDERQGSGHCLGPLGARGRLPVRCAGLS